MVQLHTVHRPDHQQSETAAVTNALSKLKNDSTATIPIEDENKYLVEFSENDSENPKNWSQVKKWTVVFAITLINICTGLAMTVYASIGDTMMRDTGATHLEYISGMTTVRLLKHHDAL